MIRILAQILKFPADKNFFALFAVFSLAAGCTVRAAGAVLAAVNRDFALCTVLRIGGIVRTEIQMSAVLADKAVIRFVVAHVFHSADLSLKGMLLTRFVIVRLNESGLPIFFEPAVVARLS